MGYAMRALTPDELATMCALLDEQLAQGAPGLSLGLIYPPGSFCDTGELLALAEVVARRDRMLAVHMRNENKGIFEALDEMVGVAKRTGVRLQISHLKLMGRSQWNRSEELLHKLDLAQAQGVRIHCDQYPYTASSSGLTSCLPQRAMDGGLSMLEARLNDPAAWESIIKGGLPELQNRGGAENIVISDTAGRYPEIEGTGLKETASRLKLSVPEAIRRILLQCGGLVNCIYHAMSRDDMLRIMDRRDIAVVSDGTAYSLAHMIGTPHPRNTSSFPCFLRMVREEKRMSIADAIYKITALPATLMGLGDRIGLLKPGYAGDITVVDFDTVADTATYREPWLAPVGVECVLVNGELVLEKGVITAARPGKFYRAGCPA
jgi:N-acyl-D-amino-acid deacylase